MGGGTVNEGKYSYEVQPATERPCFQRTLLESLHVAMDSLHPVFDRSIEAQSNLKEQDGNDQDAGST